MIMLGKMLKETGFCTECAIDQALLKCVPASKKDMIELNKKAIKIGTDL